jgi:hypothetical protein
MLNKFHKCELEDIEINAVPGTCAADVTGGACVIAVIVIIALIAQPDQVPGW